MAGRGSANPRTPLVNTNRPAAVGGGGPEPGPGSEETRREDALLGLENDKFGERVLRVNCYNELGCSGDTVGDVAISLPPSIAGGAHSGGWTKGEIDVNEIGFNSLRAFGGDATDR
jgi:hypothetical protein